MSDFSGYVGCLFINLIENANFEMLKYRQIWIYVYNQKKEGQQSTFSIQINGTNIKKKRDSYKYLGVHKGWYLNWNLENSEKYTKHWYYPLIQTVRPGSNACLIRISLLLVQTFSKQKGIS